MFDVVPTGSSDSLPVPSRASIADEIEATWGRSDITSWLRTPVAHRRNPQHRTRAMRDVQEVEPPIEPVEDQQETMARYKEASEEAKKRLRLLDIALGDLVVSITALDRLIEEAEIAGE